MEAALASVALAGNILQFVGLVRSIVTKGYQVKRSHDGALKEHKDILAVIADLDKSFETIEVPTNDTLRPVIEACRDVAVKLKSALDRAGKLKGRNLWTHVREAIVLVWNEKEITQMERRLEGLRDEVASRLQIIIKHDVERILGTTVAIDQTTRDTLAGVESLKSSTEHSAQRIRDCVDVATSAILVRCDSATLVPRELLQELRDLRDLVESMTQPNQLNLHSSVENLHMQFLETLRFPEMDNREDSIPDAHARTYDWVLADSEEDLVGTECQFHREIEQQKDEIFDSLSRLGVDTSAEKYPFSLQEAPKNSTAALQTWLKFGTGVFWIWGKPGCGKSTLMKAMLTRPVLKRRLKALLNDQCPGKLTQIASFYFFRPGMSLQKSKLGFFQSLLYQVLRHQQSNVAQLFSELDQRKYISRSQNATVLEDGVWNIHTLRRAFRKLRELDPSPLYLHIDGIDEIDCEPEEIANILKELVSYPDVKVLAAGRFHAAFDHIFDPSQRLNLHELTELDIMRYTIDTIASSALRQKLVRPAQYIEIFKEIFSAAQGVFQWVKLVVDLLMQGVRHHETFSQLLQRLKEYPKDLDKLYWYIYQSLDSRYDNDAALWILAVLEASNATWYSCSTKNRLDTQMMYVMDRYDPADDFSVDAILSEPQKSRRAGADDLQKRIQAQCLHFFDFGPRSQRHKYIYFSHRTVLDFLLQRSRHVQHELESRLKGSKNPKMYLAIGSILSKTQWLESRKDLEFRINNLHWRLIHVWTLDNELFLERVSFQFQIAVSKRSQELTPKLKQRVARPTLDGWVFENRIETWKRLRSTHFNFVHMFILHYRHSLITLEPTKYPGERLLSGMLGTTRQCIQSNATAKDDTRELFLAEILCHWMKTDFYPDHYPRGNEHAIFTCALRWIKRLTPRGVGSRCAALQMSLEFLRTTYLALELSLTLPALTMEQVGCWNYCLFVIWCLVANGADPNTMCNNVTADSDKSQYSLLSLLRRLENSRFSFVFESKFGKILQNTIQAVVNNSGTEMVILAHDHREPDLDLDNSYFIADLNELELLDCDLRWDRLSDRDARITHTRPEDFLESGVFDSPQRAALDAMDPVGARCELEPDSSR